MAKTKIEWTEYSWNPVTGCTPVSEGCQNCYAKRMAKRLRGRCGYPQDEPFRVTLHPERLGEPLRWKEPRRVFVCSMGDLFHEDVPDEFIARIWAIIASCQRHTFLVLTKRPQRMLEWVKRIKDWEGYKTHNGEPCTAYGGTGIIVGYKDWPLPNVWLGVTAENQNAADERIPILLQIPAAVRFVSVEPLLGPVDLEYYLPYVDSKYKEEWHRNGYHVRRLFKGITQGTLDWVICGGETGPGARPMHPDWVRNLRGQCQDAGVPFFFKSWGEWTAEYPQGMNLKNVKMMYCHGTTFYRVGKKLAGRILDGKEWNEFPEGKVKT